MGVWEPNLLFAAMAAVLGLILGSFYTACVHRYLAGQTLLNPRRSACPACAVRPGHRRLPPMSRRAPR